jgi:hypothetical protein
VAIPIERTAPIEGEDADLLIENLENVASHEEIDRRRDAARAFLAEVERPKGLVSALHRNAAVHAQIMEFLRTCTPAEFKASLVESGVCTPDGKLTEHYDDTDDEQRLRGDWARTMFGT